MNKMENLVLFKIVAASTLTLASALGVWLPIYFLQKHTHKSQYSNNNNNINNNNNNIIINNNNNISRYLSLANCFSAGMLLAMALVHFLPSAFMRAGSNINTFHICLSLLIGILFPALIERGIHNNNNNNKDNHNNMNHNHNHSHGFINTINNNNNNNNNNSSSSLASLVIILMCFHAAAEGALLGLEININILIRAAVPLCLHRLLDGVVVGVSIAKEIRFTINNNNNIDINSNNIINYINNYNSVGEMMPLTTGTEIVNMRHINNNNNNNNIYGGSSMSSSGHSYNNNNINNNNNNNNNETSEIDTAVLQRFYRWPVLLWLAVMPAAALICSLILINNNNNVNNINKNHHHIHSTTTTNNNNNNNLNNEETAWLAILQAIGSGFFLFAGIMSLLQEELKGIWATVALLAGVIFTFLLTASEHH